MGRVLNGGLQKRAGYGLLNSLDGLVVSLGMSDSNVSDSLVSHNRLNVCKVQIDQARNIN